MDHYYLTNEDGRWILKTESGSAPAAEFTTKTEAILHSTHLLKERQATLTIHGGDGSVEEERVFPETAGSVENGSRPALDDDILKEDPAFARDREATTV